MIRGKELKQIKILYGLPLLCVEGGENFTIGSIYEMGRNNSFLRGDDSTMRVMSRNSARFLPVAPSEVP